MDKQFFILSLGFLVVFGCKRNNTTTIVKPFPPNPLVAVAGPDTTLYVAQKGWGCRYLAILNGKSSHDSAGTIVSYVWTEVDTIATGLGSQIMSVNADSTVAYMVENTVPVTNGFTGDVQPVTNSYIREFQLEVQDDKKNVAYDTVKITLKRKFGFQYDSLSWGSTVGSLTHLSLGFDNPQILQVPIFGLYYTDSSDYMNICAAGNCIEILNWQTVPYVSYDSIQLTTNNLFYSTNSGDSSDIAGGNDWPVIYAKQNAGIDFTKRVSIGIGRLP
ncbi:MAG TPA: hypothetical protein VKR53_16030 [Puia sp.]|nr:hypothetical protein [Puia sp.]